jgi:undecaprenyl diphosphate synthase
MNLFGARHVAVIMDGNGRWAKERGWTRTRGHREGVVSVREITTECARAKLPWLTLFALSTENYRLRPRAEVSTLMVLLRRFLIAERPTLMENAVRLTSVGRVDELPEKVVRELRATEKLTARNDGMRLCLALNYGARSELADAARRLAADVRAGELPLKALDEAALGARLYDAEMPDVDLLVRTAGEMRVSNFLLWQASYAEIHVTRLCWPDFRKADMQAALADFGGRKRKFGGLKEGGSA